MNLHSTNRKVEANLDQQDNQTSLPSGEQNLKSVPIPLYCQSVYAGDFIPVLNENGRIEKLDVETLEITGDLGSMVTGTDGSLTQSVRPRDLLAYEVQFLFYKREYKGLAVACLDRNIENIAVALFDDRGARIKAGVAQNQMRPSSVPVDFSVIPISYQLSRSPFAVLYAVSRFLVETLNPLAVNMITCYTAGEFEAISSRRALFFLSDTTIGRIISGSGEELIKTAEILFLSLPAGLLGLFLAWRVSKNARQVGLSKNMQTFWIIMVIFFGIPAYIAYRLTRPEMVLVSCRNCGQMRRPDQELCHQCKSPWLVPELVPPAWRVQEG